jgi:hypothetical protein
MKKVFLCLFMPYFRNNSLVLQYIHKNRRINPEEVVNEYLKEYLLNEYLFSFFLFLSYLKFFYLINLFKKIFFKVLKCPFFKFCPTLKIFSIRHCSNQVQLKVLFENAFCKKSTSASEERPIMRSKEWL